METIKEINSLCIEDRIKMQLKIAANTNDVKLQMLLLATFANKLIDNKLNTLQKAALIEFLKSKLDKLIG